MKVATVIVGTDKERFRQVGANKERLALAERIADFVESKRVDLCVKPAGYLAATSRTISAVQAMADELAAVFGGVDLIAGVDAARTAGTAKRRDSAKTRRPLRGGWPFWGFASRRGKVTAVYQQRTVDPGEVTDNTSPRVLKVAGTRIGLLICGEVYNSALAESLGQVSPNLVVDIGHESMGRHFTATLRNTAMAVGCRVFHAQHVALRSRGASKWTATAQEAWPETNADWASYAVDDRRDALWAEVKLWRVKA
jgi:hypothetical protein